jgi:hypothetical protein
VSEVATIYIETETHRAVDFTCECGRIDCSETMMMTIAEYEAIRAHSTHFGVVPQHEQPEIESVIERHPSYFVVEKREQDAQEVILLLAACEQTTHELKHADVELDGLGDDLETLSARLHDLLGRDRWERATA